MKIENQTFQNERALYNITKSEILNVKFSGEEDGESPLKECSDVIVKNSLFDLRYALWHNKRVLIEKSTFSEKCRAPLWYGDGVTIIDCNINGVKTLRESKWIKINNSQIVSPEFMWNCSNGEINNSNIESEYAFFGDKGLTIKNVEFKGKYSFQYVNNLVIENCNLDTKDAFWHAKNVVVVNSTIKGEYLAWYSQNVTLINCTIISHQPLCYCKNLKIINCKMSECDLAFEYSNVKAIINGKINSIKNPRSGKIVANEIGEIISEESKYKTKAKIVVKEKN